MKYVNFTRIFLGCLLLVMTEVVNAYQVGVPKIVVKSFPIEMYGIDPTTEELSFPHRNPVLVYTRFYKLSYLGSYKVILHI